MIPLKIRHSNNIKNVFMSLSISFPPNELVDMTRNVTRMNSRYRLEVLLGIFPQAIDFPVVNLSYQINKSLDVKILGRLSP